MSCPVVGVYINPTGQDAPDRTQLPFLHEAKNKVINAHSPSRVPEAVLFAVPPAASNRHETDK